MTPTLSKSRRVKCEIILTGAAKHFVTSQMQRFANLVEDLVTSHNYEWSEKIKCVIDWPEEKE